MASRLSHEHDPQHKVAGAWSWAGASVYSSLGARSTQWRRQYTTPLTMPLLRGLLLIIDSGRMKGWVGVTCWPIVDCSSTKWSAVHCQFVRHRTGKVRQSKTSFLPLCYTVNSARYCCILLLSWDCWPVVGNWLEDVCPWSSCLHGLPRQRIWNLPSSWWSRLAVYWWCWEIRWWWVSVRHWPTERYSSYLTQCSVD